jgi:hypothetical protein
MWLVLNVRPPCSLLAIELFDDGISLTVCHFGMSFVSDASDDLSLLAETRAQSDPSVSEGFAIVFNNEVPIKFPDADVPRIVRVRVLEKRESDDAPVSGIRLELRREDRVEFCLTSSFEERDYTTFKKQNRLSVEFDKFSQSLIDLFTRSVKQPRDYKIQFEEDDQLVFIQSLRLRAVEVFRLSFKPVSDDFVRKQVQFRFNTLKMELQRAAQEYNTLMSRLEGKNPSLAKQIKKIVETTAQEAQ